MSWLARWDAKARTWPIVFRWLYRAVKLYLIALGGYFALGLAYIEVIEEHRVGLGSGITVAFLLALIKGVFMAARPPAPSPPPQADSGSR